MANPFQNLPQSQINPALIQAMSVARSQSQNSSSGPNSNYDPSQSVNVNVNGAGAGFNPIYQTFQRLQSEGSAKIAQQRLGHGGPSQYQVPNFTQQQQQQQGGSQDQNQKMMMMMQQHAQGNAGQQAMGQGGGMNMHSQQQGLNLQGAGETEVERRQMLSK